MRVLLLVALQVAAGGVPPCAQERYGADWRAAATVHLPKQGILLTTQERCLCAHENKRSNLRQSVQGLFALACGRPILSQP